MGILSFMDEFIENMKRIFCLFDSIPGRIANIKAGITETSLGSVEFIGAVGTAATMTKDESFALFEYIGILLFSYLGCMGQYFVNLYKCIWIYFIDIIGKILYLPFRFILWSSFYYLSLDMYPIEKVIWDFLEVLNGGFKSITGQHLIHFSDKIRGECYICATLKSEVISKQNQKLKTTFNKTIPGILATAGINKINRGARLFNESVQLNVRTPNKVI